MGEKKFRSRVKGAKKLVKSLLLGSAISIGLLAIEYPKAAAQLGISGGTSQAQSIDTCIYLE
ncbi:MAG: hypothetical protein ACFBSE_24715 [Prochloraceae cyanobacterium]